MFLFLISHCQGRKPVFAFWPHELGHHNLQPIFALIRFFSAFILLMSCKFEVSLSRFTMAKQSLIRINEDRCWRVPKTKLALIYSTLRGFGIFESDHIFVRELWLISAKRCFFFLRCFPLVGRGERVIREEIRQRRPFAVVPTQDPGLPTCAHYRLHKLVAIWVGLQRAHPLAPAGSVRLQ